MFARPLRSPGLQSTDARFPNRPVDLRDERENTSRKRRRDGWSGAKRRLCKAQGCAQFCRSLCSHSDQTQGRRLASLSLCRNTTREDERLRRLCHLRSWVRRCRWRGQWEDAGWYCCFLSSQLFTLFMWENPFTLTTKRFILSFFKIS